LQQQEAHEAQVVAAAIGFEIRRNETQGPRALMGHVLHTLVLRPDSEPSADLFENSAERGRAGAQAYAKVSAAGNLHELRAHAAP